MYLDNKVNPHTCLQYSDIGSGCLKQRRVTVQPLSVALLPPSRIYPNCANDMDGDTHTQVGQRILALLYSG